jgi:hypothetical protein
MSALKRLWTKTARFAEALEGMDDPTGDYILSLGKRIDQLERDLSQLESQLHLHSRADGSGVQQ